MQQSAPAQHSWRLRKAPDGARATPANDRPLPLRQRRKPRRKAAGLTAFTAAVIGAIAFGVLTQGGSNARQAQPFIDEADKIAEQAGLGVRHVYLAGHRKTADAEIFEALDLIRARSLLRFDILGAKARIEALPWVKTATITRILPDTIDIQVTERSEFAVWHRGGRDEVIDVTGRVLGIAPHRIAAELPRVVGEGANAGAAGMLELINRHPQLATRLQEVERVDDRRWTLRLRGGLDVLLPADGEAEALARLTADPAATQLLEGGQFTRIDLRTSGRMIVRPVQQPVAGKDTTGRQTQPSG